MSSSGISLADKTIILAGTFGPLFQSLASGLTEHGADVALLCDDNKGASRFCQNLTDLREVSEKFGRAAAFECNFSEDKEIQNAFSRSAETFGTIDAFVDTHLSGVTPKGAADVLSRVQSFAQCAIPFLKSRGRGRVVYFGSAFEPYFSELSDYTKKMSVDLLKDQVAVNALALGVTEDYLLKNNPKAKSIQMALKELQADKPRVRLVDYKEAVQTCVFFVSPLSAAINGQAIKINHGVD